MSGLYTAIATVVVSGAAAVDAHETARKAGKAQERQANAAIANSKDQFGQIKALLAPYVQAGDQATDSQRALLGLAGPEAQAGAVKGVENGAQFQALAKSGEDAILQNASATGGLRGGNVQGALGQFRPQLLNTLINQRFAQLGDVAGRGQASAAGQAALQGQNAGQVAGLLTNVGQAQAGAALGQGAAVNSAIQGFGTAAGQYFGARPNGGAPASGTPYYIAAPNGPAVNYIPSEGTGTPPPQQPGDAPYYLAKF